jgi:LPXTG-motif cell wall-anchored protein
LKRILGILSLSMIMLLILPTALVGAAGSKSWYLSDAGHPVVANALDMGTNIPLSTGNVNFNKESEHVWLADQAAQAAVTFPAGTWTIVLKTGDDWYSDMQIQLGYWDGSFNAFGGQTSSKISSVNGLITIEIQISFPSQTIDAGEYLGLRILNVGKNPHHILTGESRIDTPPSDPGYPLPEWTSAILLGLGLAGIGGFVLLRRKQVRSLAKGRN